MPGIAGLQAESRVRSSSSVGIDVGIDGLGRLGRVVISGWFRGKGTKESKSAS